jgi:hypothetical protein
MAFTEKLSAGSKGLCSGRDDRGQGFSHYFSFSQQIIQYAMSPGNNKSNWWDILINQILLISIGLPWHPFLESETNRFSTG